MRAGPVVVATATLVALALAACEGARIGAVDCGAIPEGGCPTGLVADACVDGSCRALYTCTEDRAGSLVGTWKPAGTCPARADSGAPDSGLGDGGDASPLEGGSAYDGPVPDGATGGPNCPGLQAPDCAAGTAISCPSGCCGCEDLFVCVNSGWEPWGTCADGTIRTF